MIMVIEGMKCIAVDEYNRSSSSIKTEYKAIKMKQKWKNEKELIDDRPLSYENICNR